MLVLSRRQAETIVIDGRIRVTVLGVSGSTVRLGIEAPAEVSVHREEIHRKIRERSPQTDPSRLVA